MGRIDTYPQNAVLQPNSPVTLAYAQAIANQGSITTVVDLTGLTVSVVVPEGRRIRITGQCLFQSTVADDVPELRIMEGSTQLVQIDGIDRVANIVNTVTGSVIITPTAGLHTYKLMGLRAIGSGTVTMVASSTFPAYILVEDITGMPVPTATSSVPVGQIGYAQVIAVQGSITTEVDLTGLSVNVVVPSGRTIRITGFVPAFSSTVSGDGGRISIKEGATLLTLGQAFISGTAAGANSLMPQVILSPSAGSHTYKLTGARVSGSGTFTMNADPTFPAYIIVEDITATPAAGNGATSSTLGYAENTTTQAAVGTGGVDLTGLSVTVTVPAGRRLMVTGYGGIPGSASANLSVNLAINEGATQLQRTDDYLPTAFTGGPANVSVVISPSAGTHTYKLVGYSSTGTFTFNRSSTFPAYILVEDITGSTYTYTQPGVLSVTSSAPPANPQIGAMIYEIDTGATKIWTGAAWQIFGQGSTQTLGYAEITANSATFGTTQTDIAGLSTTVTVPAGRRIRISSMVHFATSSGSPNLGTAFIYEGATEVAKWTLDTPLAQAEGAFPSVILTPTAGIHTYNVKCVVDTGVGILGANANEKCYILVEDITGTNAPAPAVNVPVGVIAQAQSTVSVGPVTTPTQLLSVNVSVPAGRVLKITAGANVSMGTAGGRTLGTIALDGTAIGRWIDRQLPTSGYYMSASDSVLVSPSAGSHTITMTIDPVASASTSVEAASTEPIHLFVEDVTPTPAVATGAPSSTLGYAEVTANQNSIGTSPTDLIGLSVTVTVSAGRRLRITGKGFIANDTTAGAALGEVLQDGSIIGRWYRDDLGVSNASMQAMETVITPAAGTHTYKLTLYKNGGTGTINYQATSTNPGYILVEDITGVAIPRDTNINTVNYILNTTANGAGGNTSSITYVDYPTAIDKTFTKGLTATSLIVQGAVGNYLTVSAGITYYALLINGVDYPIAQFFFNDLSTHRSISFHTGIASGLAAGTYTARLRWAVDNAGRTANVDGNDRIYISITEGITG